MRVNIHRWAVLLGAVMLGSAIVVPVTADAQATEPTAILIVGNAASPTIADLTVRDRLTDTGLEVNVVDDDAEASVGDVDLVLISATVTPSKIGSTLTGAAVPMIVWEPLLYDDLGMTGSNSRSRGTDTSERSLDIVDDAHPLASGLSGRVRVGNQASTFGYGVPSAEADVVATIRGRPTRPAIFVYDAGDEMIGATAPAVRIGLHFGPAATRYWTDEGALMFDAAVEYALSSAGAGGGGGGEEPNEAPSVDAGPNATIEIGEVLQLAGIVDDDGLPSAALTVAWTGPETAVISDPGDLSATVSFTDEGTYELQLDAFDGELTGSDSMTVAVTPARSETSTLFVAGSSTGTSHEQAAIDRLVGLGHVVTVIDDNVAQAADAVGFDLVVVSSTISPHRLDDAFGMLAVPTIVWEPLVFDEFGFTSTNSRGGQATDDEIRIVSEHPVVDGMDPLTKIYTGDDRVSWGRLEGEPEILAVLRSTATKSSLFLYDVGSQLHDDVAPARRVGFFLGDRGPSRLTDNGWTLFDRSIDWVLSANDAPSVDIGPDLLAAADTPLQLSATVTDDGRPTPPGALSTTWSGPAAATFADPTDPNTSVSFSASGTFVLTLTADDSQLAASDSLEVVVPNQPPVAVADVTSTNLGGPGVIGFNSARSSDVDGTIVSWEWDFGDGTPTSSEPGSQHSFAEAGVYQVVLTVTDNQGSTARDRRVVRVGVAAPTRVADGVVALYDFSEGDGATIVDRSGSGLDLAIADLSATTWLPHGGLRFDGPTSAISSGPATAIVDAVKASGAITVEAFIDPAVVDPVEPSRIVTISPDDQVRNVSINQGQNATSNTRFEGRLTTSETSASGYPSAESPIGSVTGELVHVVFTRAADGAERIYLDGALVDEAQVGGTLDGWDATWPLTLGSEANGLFPWLGTIHLVALYSRALSHDELCQNLAAGPGRTVGIDDRAPVACLVGNVAGGPAPLTISPVSASSDPDGADVNVSWDFGDGTTATGESPTHVYSTDGDHRLTMTVADSAGATTTRSVTVVVRDAHLPAAQPSWFAEALGMRTSGGFFNLDGFLRAEALLDRPISTTVEFLDRSSPANMRSSSFGLLLSDGADVPLVADRVDLSIAVPLGFGDAKPRTPDGIAAVAANLEAVANGDHDADFLTVAQNLVAAGFDDAIVRLGWEFNGTFLPYSSREGNDQRFVDAWRHVHDLFESVSPAFRFDWTSLRSPFAVHGPPAWPGDDYVDFVGLDMYWRVDAGDATWSDTEWQSGFQNVLDAQLAFALEHGKQLSYPEWAVYGADEPRFIEYMYDWFVSLPASGPGSLAYQSYFDSGTNRERLIDHPNTRERFRQLFGMPGS